LSIIEPKILKGFRDFLPQAEMERKKLIRTLEDTFESYGFVPIDTPILEYTEVLLGKGSGETDKQLYRFNDNGGRDVAMRFDLTVPFARYIAANRHHLYLPFKRYHINKVWRGENSQKGRYREFYQCDFDMVGVDNANSDFEILQLMNRSFQVLPVGDYQFHLSHRGVFNQFLSKEGLLEHSVEILRTVDKLAKIGREKTLQLLQEMAPGQQGERILSFIEQKGEFLEVLSHLETLSGGPSEASERLRQIWALIESQGLQHRFILDPSITRGLDYYTGIVYETFLSEARGIGSVCSGGRYNDLASLYTKEQLPGVGSSIGLDRLLAALEMINSDRISANGPEILLFCQDDTLYPDYFSLAEKLRKEGFNTEVYPLKKKLPQQFKYAEAKGFSFGIIMGQNEKSEGKMNLKNLTTRETKDGLTFKEVVEYLQNNR